ncbi:MAG: hypothetical protein IAI49_12655, partial [Candidatus Eremiobacteraeota bacterium]|nr:hypothetical protein [Candidatus Eremiobacteraeota bacterium]
MPSLFDSLRPARVFALALPLMLAPTFAVALAAPPEASTAASDPALDAARTQALAGDLNALRDFVKAHPGDRDAERSLGDAYVR